MRFHHAVCLNTTSNRQHRQERSSFGFEITSYTSAVVLHNAEETVIKEFGAESVE